MKLFALDMDGTLLQPDHRTVSEQDRQAILAAAEAGAWFVPATGRMAHFLPLPVQELSCWRYAITSNGAAVYDRRDNTLIYSDSLDASLVREILATLEPFSQFFEIYADGESFIERKRLEHPIDYHIPPHSVEFFLHKGNLVDSIEQVLDGSHRVEKIYIPYLSEERREAMKRLLVQFPVLVTSSIGTNLEVNSQTATKGNALHFLRQHLGLRREELLAMGDQDNDLSMIRYAGIGVAMGNAADAVKAEADFVTKSNVENGVSHALHRFVLSQEAT